MNLFRSLRERFGRVIWVVIGSVALLGCGLLFALVLAPQQKLEARRIERMPVMDANIVVNTAAGEDVLVTGWLNAEPLPGVGDFIAYKLEQWEVTPPDPDEPGDESSGSWKEVERVVPDLDLDADGQIVWILAAEGVYLNGKLHEEIVGSGSYDSADYMGQNLSEGSSRYRGFYSGDLATVWGKKASAGGVIPDELFAGDRVTFIESKHDAAKGLLIAGISMLVCSPVVLIGGILSAIFGRRRR